MNEEIDIEHWPDCAVTGCPNKCCLRLDSKYCYPHTREFFVDPASEAKEHLIPDAKDDNTRCASAP